MLLGFLQMASVQFNTGTLLQLVGWLVIVAGLYVIWSNVKGLRREIEELKKRLASPSATPT